MHAIQDHPLPFNPILTAKQAKPLVITGSVAIVASVVSAVAVIIFATALMPILLPITATVAAAGVICLSIGLHALRMHAKNEAERDRKVAGYNDLIQKDDIDAAQVAFNELPKENQAKAFEDLASTFLETGEDKLRWLLKGKKEALPRDERLAVCVKLIERRKEQAKFDAIHNLLNTLEIDVEQQNKLEVGLCNYYMEQKRFEEAFGIAQLYELHETINLLFEEFLKIKNVEKCEQILRLNPNEEKVLNRWVCQLAAVYVDLNEMEKAMNMLHHLKLKPTNCIPELKLYEILQIKLYHHFKDDAKKAKEALESVAFTLAGGFCLSEQEPNYHSMAFSQHLENNIPQSFINNCQQALWDQAHEVLVQTWEEYKKQAVAEPNPQDPLFSPDDGW
jgi:hypothetical protein